jgi:hypothetical protein
MNKLTISVLAGAAGLFVSTAGAAPLVNGTPSVANGAENVRMVCNENGQCWQHGGEHVLIQRDRNAYAPRERYIDRRQYRDYDRGPGIGFHAPGVSVGIGDNRW